MTIRVVVADDQAMVRAGFRRLLESEPDIDVVGEAADGSAAVDLVTRLRPNVALLDIRMPNMDGIEATRRIAVSQTRVVILTTFDLDEYVYDALRAGATGFLLKDAPPELMIAAVHAAAAGDALIAPSVTRRLLAEFARRPEPIDAAAQLSALTERERDVMLRLGRGMSNAEIAADLFLGEATIKTHVGNVLAKLGLRDRVQAVVFAYETGLVRPGD
ncbi:MAG TPA: response regulator transcription factor [Acidothermaceae bacterium]|nr:response regulator transcription factor [Acidothermaceae bacterium]